MENLSNPIEPTPNLIDLESENIFGDNLKHASSTSTKKAFKKHGFHILLFLIPLLVIIVAAVSINQELKKLKNDFSTQMKNISETFKNDFEQVKNDTKDGLNKLEQNFNRIKKDFNVSNQYLNELRILNGSYEEIGWHWASSGHKILIAKTKTKMNFTNGQIACKMANGFMFDFDETNKDIKNYYKILAQKFGNEFYTNIQKDGNIWKRVRDGQILGHTKDILWNKGEPSNDVTENCAQVQRDEKNLYEETFGLNDVECSTKSNIICIKNYI